MPFNCALTFEEQAARSNYPTCSYAREGYYAFHDGLTLDMCLYPIGHWTEYRWKVGWYIGKTRGIIPMTVEELDAKYHRMVWNTGVSVYAHCPPVPVISPYQFLSPNGIKQILYWIEEEPPQAKPMYLAPEDYEFKPYEHPIAIMGGGVTSVWAVFRKEIE